MFRQIATGACLAAALLAGGMDAASARPAVSVDLNIGVPVYGAGYYGARYDGGPYYGRGYYGRGYYRRGGGVWLHPWWGPGVVFAGPPLIYSMPATPVEIEPAPVSVPANRPDPIIYPRNGQSAQQTEGDRQECNRWAVTQPSAVADAGVFQRAVEACMDGRGYSMK